MWLKTHYLGWSGCYHGVMAVTWLDVFDGEGMNRANSYLVLAYLGFEYCYRSPEFWNNAPTSARPWSLGHFFFGLCPACQEKKQKGRVASRHVCVYRRVFACATCTHRWMYARFDMDQPDGLMRTLAWNPVALDRFWRLAEAAEAAEVFQ